MTAPPPSIASAAVVPLPRRYWRLPPDGFARRGRCVDIMPDGNGHWMALEQTEDSGGVLISGTSKLQALFAGVAFALRHNASMTLHMYDADRTLAAPLARRGR